MRQKETYKNKTHTDILSLIPINAGETISYSLEGSKYWLLLTDDMTEFSASKKKKRSSLSVPSSANDKKVKNIIFKLYFWSNV